MRAQNDRAIVPRAPVCTYDIMPASRMKRIVLGEGKAREVRRTSIAFLKTPPVYDAFQFQASATVGLLKKNVRSNVISNKERNNYLNKRID